MPNVVVPSVVALDLGRLKSHCVFSSKKLYHESRNKLNLISIRAQSHKTSFFVTYTFVQ